MKNTRSIAVYGTVFFHKVPIETTKTAKNYAKKPLAFRKTT